MYLPSAGKFPDIGSRYNLMKSLQWTRYQDEENMISRPGNDAGISDARDLKKPVGKPRLHTLICALGLDQSRSTIYITESGRNAVDINT